MWVRIPLFTLMNRKQYQAEYYQRNKDKHRQNVVNNVRKRRIKDLEKLGGRCVFCGYNKFYGALEFHHLDRNDKNHTRLGGLQRQPVEVREEELKKCIVLCSNHHRELENWLYKHDRDNTTHLDILIFKISNAS